MGLVSGRQAPGVELTSEEREYLSRQVRRHKVSRSFSERCEIVLPGADGLNNLQISSQ